MKKTVRELESIFRNITSSSYPYEWDENHITFSLMRELRTLFAKRRVYYKGFNKIIEWKSYKNKGKVENLFGDISLFINIQFSSGETLRGVAFLEAKRDSASGNFESISMSQLERIHINAPYSYLLLYLHQIEDRPIRFPDDGTWKSNVWTAPVNTMIQKLAQLSTSNNSRALRVTLPFSKLIVSRFFWGLDLDFRPSAFSLAVNGLDDIPPSSFLGVINVYYENQFPIAVDLDETWEPI